MSTTESVPPVAKIVFIGDERVGKSALMARFVKDQYIGDDTYKPTIGVEFAIRVFEVATSCGAERAIKVQMWDAAGQERFRAISKAYLRGAHGVVLVYDVTDKESFNNVSRWIEEINNAASTENSDKPVVMLLGNKRDLAQQQLYGGAGDASSQQPLVPARAGEELVDRENFFSFAEVSAKTGEGLEQAMGDFLSKISREKLVPTKDLAVH